MTIDNYGYKFYNEVLKSPKLIIAPMVDYSELPFRELCRKYGAQLGYTPMIPAKHFVGSARIREQYLYSQCYDRPLIAQFCVNNLDLFLKAIELAKGYCDAIDINLGCPQNIAKRGRYGAFLQDDWKLIETLIKEATNRFNIPITCKIRIFDDEKKTIEYAKMIERAGCYLLTVHGRTREMKGQFTGLADWNVIKKIKEQLKIPVFANGNIQTYSDVEECIRFTKVDGVMSAEGLLYNPALFKSLHLPCWTLIDEYLQIAKDNNDRFKSNAYIRGHLFKIAYLTLQLPENLDLREKLIKCFNLDEFQAFSNELRTRYELNENQIVQMTTLPVPHYLTQPYFHHPLIPKINNNNSNKSESLELVNANNRKRKKSKQENNVKRQLPLCSSCTNPKGLSCNHNLCKTCCKTKCFENDYYCTAHRYNLKSNEKKEQCKPDAN